jgi:hypothetical protein
MSHAAAVENSYVLMLGQAKKRRAKFVYIEIDLPHFAQILSRPKRVAFLPEFA